MKQFEQVWKYISLPMAEGTCDPMTTLYPPHSDGFIRLTHTDLYKPVTYDYDKEGYVPCDLADDPHTGVLFEIFHQADKIHAKVAVSGIVPMRVGQLRQAADTIEAGHWVYYHKAHDASTKSGIAKLHQGIDLNNFSLIGIALASGTTDDYIPVLLKEIPDYEWIGA